METVTAIPLSIILNAIKERFQLSNGLVKSHKAYEKYRINGQSTDIWHAKLIVSTQTKEPEALILEEFESVIKNYVNSLPLRDQSVVTLCLRRPPELVIDDERGLSQAVTRLHLIPENAQPVD